MKQYNLEERTFNFGKEIVLLCKDIKRDVITLPLISQLIRSSTSVGANYLEANGACSKKDFINKIYICKKEAQETRHWLKLLEVATYPSEIIEKLISETNELAKIFHTISSKSN